MKRSATLFVAVWFILSLTFSFLIFGFAEYEGSKTAWFMALNSLFLIGLGVFFAVYRNHLFLLLENYKREKEI